MENPLPRAIPGFKGITLLALGFLVIISGKAAWAEDFSTGFGLVYGQGKTVNGARIIKAGFTTKKLQQNSKLGSLALIFEQHENGVPLTLIDPALTLEDVEVKYEALYLEMKRYFPIGGGFHYYWALKGGATRLTGQVLVPGGTPVPFEAQQIAPLAPLSIPLMLENPGFFVLAFLDGSSMGLTYDLVPNKAWFDFQIGTSLLPSYRDEYFAVEEKVLVTQVLQFSVAF